MKYYGTSLCPDCVEADKQLAEKEIACEYICITESTANLKEFLALRDARPEFEEVKREGGIGIPSFLKEDGSIVFSVEEI